MRQLTRRNRDWRRSITVVQSSKLLAGDVDSLDQVGVCGRKRQSPRLCSTQKGRPREPIFLFHSDGVGDTIEKPIGVILEYRKLAFYHYGL